MGQREAGVGYAHTHCKYAKQIDNKLRENLYYTSVFPYGSQYYLFAVLLINIPTAIAAIPSASLSVVLVVTVAVTLVLLQTAIGSFWCRRRWWHVIRVQTFALLGGEAIE